MDLRHVAPLFLIFLTAGYIFSRDFWVTKWRTNRSESQRLLFESAFWGMVLVIVSWVFLTLLEPLTHLEMVQNMSQNKFIRHLSQVLPVIPSLPVFLGALVLAKLLPPLFNNMVDPAVFIVKYGNELEVMLNDAMQSKSMISLHLKNDKVYIGWPITTARHTLERGPYLRILPAFSGFRDKDTHVLELTTQYLEIYHRINERYVDMKGLEIKDFETVIQEEEVLSAALYDEDLNQSLFSLGGLEDPSDDQNQEASGTGSNKGVTE